jgi:hypothetical protein
LQKKRGPKRSEHRAFLRQIFSDWSDRTFETYYKAEVTFIELGDKEAHHEAIAAAARPNGGFNVTKYARLADLAVFRAVVDGRL